MGLANTPAETMEDCNYYHYSLQLNSYKWLLQKSYGVKIREMFLVVLHPDQENYIKVPINDMQDEIEEMVEMRKRELNFQDDE
jgi:hypothetical protein